jgi:hypothetical protein
MCAWLLLHNLWTLEALEENFAVSQETTESLQPSGTHFVRDKDPLGGFL